MNKALFLDRDGTLIIDKDYLSNPNEVELIPGVVEALQEAKDKGYRLFLFTNQSGVARGYFDMDAVHACNEKMIDLLGLGDDIFDDICIAPEHPNDKPEYRKPSPKFILDMIEKYKLDPQHCYMIGDRLSDLKSAINAKIRGVRVTTGKALTDEEEVLINEGQVWSYMDLRAFVEVCE